MDLNILYKANTNAKADIEKSKSPTGTPKVEMKKLKIERAIMTGISIIIKGNIIITQIIPKGHTAEIKNPSSYTLYIYYYTNSEEKYQ